MTKQEIEYAVISNAINTLCVLCAGNRSIVINKLTGYLWDEVEAEGIRKSKGKQKNKVIRKSLAGA